MALSVVNGDSWLLDRFAALKPDAPTVVDIDLTIHGATAWVVHQDRSGGWWQSTVELDQTADGMWRIGAQSDSSWDSCAELATSRPPRAWLERGPVLALTLEAGTGSVPQRTFTSVCGIAAEDVVAIEFGFGHRTRHRAIDTPTGGFIITVPEYRPDQSPTFRATYTDGSTIDLKP